MEGSTDETVERDIWSRSLKQWLEAKIQAAVSRLPEPTPLVHLDHHHASSSRRRAVRVWRIGGVGAALHFASSASCPSSKPWASCPESRAAPSHGSAASAADSEKTGL